MSARRTLLPALAVVLLAAGCDSGPPTSPTPRGEFSQTDLRVGTGAEATAGRTLSVNYALWLYSDSAADNKGQGLQSGPHTFVLGARNVISGWERGVPGMRVGGLRRLVIPPELAYGPTGSGPIPPNATLVFEIELLNVQ